MSEKGIFSFEFHLLIPVTESKTIAEALKSTSLKLYGRNKNFESICANVVAYLPYFYLSSENVLNNFEHPLGNEDELKRNGINIDSFRTSILEKIPFYNFYTGTKTFIKVECCSETVRKQIVNFVKDSPNLFYSLYEAHISFALQFMSDYGIVGMGLVHAQNAIFLGEKSSTCDLECYFSANDIINNELMAQINTNKSLLPSLSLFMENLGISDLSICDQLNQDIQFVSCNQSLSEIWPKNSKKKIDAVVLKSNIKCPTFKSYIFRKPPPIEVYEYFPQTILDSTKYNFFGPNNYKCCYIPALKPPEWPDKEMESHKHRNNTSNQLIDKLTVDSGSKNSFSLYDFNGDFYLKFFVLECYESAIEEFPSISTITFSIITGSQSKAFLFTTNNCTYYREQKFITKCFKSEFEMINELIQVIIREDPDILAGFEIDNKSWGYVAKRFDFLNGDLSINFQSCIDRQVKKTKSYLNADPWMTRASSQFQVQGRIVFNLWRIYRDEIALRYYNLSEIYKFYFKTSVSYLSVYELIKLMHEDTMTFCKHIMLKLDHICDLITKTSFLIKSIEFSRLFGIDLFSTLTRGSQYRVESILIRASHSENYLLKTPSEAEVRQMRAAQGLPLTMEPISNFYRDPIVVLDFQSLYPSMIIAYNICYSTVIGTVKDKIVASCGTMISPSPKLYNFDSFSSISDYPIFNAPGNIAFVRKDLKDGLIPRLLNEILSTRIAIKNAMKSCDSKIKSVLDARQLALKYISNVTYGYTSASFSGRMPNVDIADAIVLSGRKTLERAIDIIESHSTWEAKVVYGDTDSLFVLLPGRTKNEAFKLGRDMANVITAQSPFPVALKFEKVYFPSVLMSKKRYCGYKFESEDSNPLFDAKGIETVRRDGCPLAAKILEKSLTLFFTRNDENLLKEYVQRQLIKILSYQKINIFDFVFAREVRFGTYRSEENNRLPLSAIAAKQRQIKNPRESVSYGERVPFVIVAKPFCKLYQQVVDLDEFLNGNYRLDVVYYSTKQILTVLSRSFQLFGIDVWRWYNELPIAQLKNLCNPVKDSVFGRCFSFNYLTHESELNHFSFHLQKGLRLQDLIKMDHETKLNKYKCCGMLNCSNWTCEACRDRFNFEHRFSSELCDLSQSFNI